MAKQPGVWVWSLFRFSASTSIRFTLGNGIPRSSDLQVPFDFMVLDVELGALCACCISQSDPQPGAHISYPLALPLLLLNPHDFQGL